MTAVLEKQNRFQLKNGVLGWFRPILDTDTPYLLDIFYNLSPDSRYQRFQQSLEGVTESQAKLVAAQTAYDSVAHGFGYLAFADLNAAEPVPVGGARYYIYDHTPECGELAITIRDDMQGQGLGYRLLDALIEQAREQGVRFITGVALASNSGLWQLLKRTGLPLDRWYDGPDMYFKLTL